MPARKGKRKRRYADDWYDTLPDGSKKRRTKFYATAAERDLARRERERLTPGGRPAIDPMVTVRELSERFLAQVGVTAKGNTFFCYSSNLSQHLLPRFKDVAMRGWHRADLADFLTQKMTSPVLRGTTTLRPKYSPASIRAMIATASALASYAVRMGVLPFNPFFRLGIELKLHDKPKARQRTIQAKALTREQVRLFVGKAETVAPRDMPLFLMLDRAGLRIGEVLAIRDREDIDWSKNTVQVQREKVLAWDPVAKRRLWVLDVPKSDHAIRTVALSPQLAAVLKKHIARRKADTLRQGWGSEPPWLFYANRDPRTYLGEVDGTLDGGNVRRTIRRICGLLDNFPDATPHWFRHGFASTLLSEGKDVQTVQGLLGHESIRLTVDTYGNSLPRRVTDAPTILDDPEWATQG